MAIVVFDKCKFLDRYPEFIPTVAANATSAENCFEEATLFLDNTNSSRIPAPTRVLLLNMLTAHIMAINFGINGQGASALVGRIASAGEGSVNVSADMGPATSQKAWYEQTKYGAAYWRASMAYRSATFIPPPRGACCNRLR